MRLRLPNLARYGPNQGYKLNFFFGYYIKQEIKSFVNKRKSPKFYLEYNFLKDFRRFPYPDAYPVACTKKIGTSNDFKRFPFFFFPNTPVNNHES